MSKADEEAHRNPLLVMVDEETGEKYARAVGRKGVGEMGEMDWLIKDASEELKSWGHAGGEGGELILKCDGERAIVGLRDAIARYHGGRVVPEQPAKSESQSNGAAEEAGKSVREFVRVLKEQVEGKAAVSLEPGDAMILWMVRWSAMLCSRYVVGADGRTGYERRRGRKCKLPDIPLGEKVWYKQIRDGKERKDKFSSEWKEGLWLGHARGSNDTLIGTREGVVRAYAVRRREEDARWDRELLKELRGQPQQPDPSKGGLHIPVQIGFDPSDGGRSGTCGTPEEGGGGKEDEDNEGGS